MPLPLLFIGIAVATGAVGLGAGTKAGFDQYHAQQLNENTDERMKEAANRLNVYRQQCEHSLENLGEEKLFVLNGNISAFLDTFTQIKNVDFQESNGLRELNKLAVDKKEFQELGEMRNFAATVSSGLTAGVVGGALAAFGAYSAASTFAAASTGTAIASLSGAAASNATLAFFGGGSLAAGGLGMAGGAAVLGGLVAGPALMIMGIIIGAKAGKNLEDAKANAAEATVYCEQMEAGVEQCIAIRRRTDMFYSLLAILDSRFLPLIHKMQEIVSTEGYDYSKYSIESKKAIASAASMAVSVKAVLDTALLTEDGSLTEQSESILSTEGLPK
ncbi:MAG: hypothetical protein IJ598_00395 [Ruminococcus sp.]|nr:hypothetical protein [Bacillota bacterium]MBR1481410.1 hypothetical protein [Ruminococcus sp.]